MQAPPQLPGVRVAPPVSMQEQITMKGQKQISVNVTAPMTLVVPTSSMIRNIPVSLSGSDSKSHHSSAVTSSDISKELIIVDSHTGLVEHKESQSAQSQTSQSQTNQSQSVNENVYRLSEVVLQEKEALFRDGDSDAVYVLEPPREGLQTVRMRSKNFFTVLEESDEESEGKKTATQDQEKQLKTNFPLYTPVFNVGQSLHHIFNQSSKHKRRNKGQAVAQDDAPVDTVEGSDMQLIQAHNSHRGYESDPGQCQHWHEKIAMTSGMRKNRSQPNLETLSVEEFIDREIGSKTSLSAPTTPGPSPKLIRRNSLNNRSMELLKPELRKPDSTGPGLSFLASVAGELRSYKKRYNNPKAETQLAEYKRDNLAVEIQRPGGVEIPKRPSSTSSVESSPGTSPKPNRGAMEMQANDLPNAGKQRSFFKSVMDWGTTKQTVVNKEHNMFSPTSF